MIGALMLEFRKYSPAPAEEKDPPVCVVSYPEACNRPAVGEVWALPFCEARGKEAVAAARLEAFEDAEGELHGLLGHLGNTRPARNPLLIAAVRAATVPGERPSPDHGEAIRAAYALREEDTDPDTLAYDYGEASRMNPRHPLRLVVRGPGARLRVHARGLRGRPAPAPRGPGADPRARHGAAGARPRRHGEAVGSPPPRRPRGAPQEGGPDSVGQSSGQSGQFGPGYSSESLALFLGAF